VVDKGSEATDYDFLAFLSTSDASSVDWSGTAPEACGMIEWMETPVSDVSRRLIQAREIKQSVLIAIMGPAALYTDSEQASDEEWETAVTAIIAEAHARHRRRVA
jgi:hypothetical protein